MKTIETILKLSKNPFYKLSEEELDILREYNENLVRHNADFEKDYSYFNKHKTYLEVEE